MRRVFLIVLAMMSVTLTVAADEVHLTNGQMLEGLVLRETDTQLVLQVAWEGHIVLDRSAIVRVKASSKAERAALLDSWEEEHEAFQEREAREREFEETQRAKGLILHRGEWVTQEEINAIKAGAISLDEERVKREAAEDNARREAASRKQLETELATITDRLVTMQAEQLRLQQEISSLRYLLARRSAYPRVRYPQLPRYFRDGRGRQYPSTLIGGRTVIELPDGSSCDVDAVAGGGHRYRDPSGMWHDLHPVLEP